jgi:hypothetical protein
MFDIKVEDEKVERRKRGQTRGRKIQTVKCVRCGTELFLMRKQTPKTLCWECQKIRAIEQAKVRHSDGIEIEDPNKASRIE